MRRPNYHWPPAGGPPTPLPPYNERRAALLERLAKGPYIVSSPQPAGRPNFTRDLADLATMVKEGLVKRVRERTWTLNGHHTARKDKKFSRRTYTKYVLVNPPDPAPVVQREPYKKRHEANAEFHDANPTVHRRTRHRRRPTAEEPTE